MNPSLSEMDLFLGHITIMEDSKWEVRQMNYKAGISYYIYSPDDTYSTSIYMGGTKYTFENNCKMLLTSHRVPESIKDFVRSIVVLHQL